MSTTSQEANEKRGFTSDLVYRNYQSDCGTHFIRQYENITHKSVTCGPEYARDSRIILAALFTWLYECQWRSGNGSSLQLLCM